MITPLPGDKDCKPGAAMRPFYGVDPVLVDAEVGTAVHVGRERK